VIVYKNVLKRVNKTQLSTSGIFRVLTAVNITSWCSGALNGYDCRHHFPSLIMVSIIALQGIMSYVTVLFIVFKIIPYIVFAALSDLFCPSVF
jgi:hypothetical protein